MSYGTLPGAPEPQKGELEIPLQLDDENLHRAVKQHAPGTSLIAIERMTGGVSAEVYRLELLNAGGVKENVVLRLHGETHYGHDAELEFQTLDALFRAGIPVPRPLALDASCAILDHPFLIMAFVDGHSDIEPTKIKTRIETMVEHLISIHDVPIGALPALPRRIDPVPELLEFLPSAAAWDDFRVRLNRLKSSPFEGPDAVLHGDYWPSNLLWSGGQIAAILDWEDAAIGDPLSDVACACLELRYIYGKDGMDLFEAAYARHCEIDRNRFALWLAYVSAAAMRFMGDWGLEPAREAQMRQAAHDTLRESAETLI